MITHGGVLAAGKTKIVWDNGEGTVRIQSKDAITAGDGAYSDKIDNKSVLATTTTANCFELLRRKGIPTHYVGRHSPTEFIARRVDMIPLEVVVRRIATGSYLKRRPDVVEGTIFDELVVELFEKDDANHDPLVIPDIVGERLLRYAPSKPMAEGFVNEEPWGDSLLRRLSHRDVFTLGELGKWVFQELEAAWSTLNIALVDLKIECGWDVSCLPSGQDAIVVADVIDNDSWRIWPAGDKTQMLDKQVYRDLVHASDSAARAKELGAIKANYQYVANLTSRFDSLWQ